MEVGEEAEAVYEEGAQKGTCVNAHRVFILLTHIISFSGGPFKQAPGPMIPRNSATKESTTIWRRKGKVHTLQEVEERRSIRTNDGSSGGR